MSNVSHQRMSLAVHRKTHTFAVALWIALPMSQNAQASPEHDALLFVDSQVLPKKAAVCFRAHFGLLGQV